jgi:internalin A
MIAALRIGEAQSTHATELDLSRCGLSAIPGEVFKMTKLQTLNLEYNDVEWIPQDIANLSNLRDLRIWSQYLKRISDAIGELSELTRLTIGYGLSQLPDGIGRCGKLRRLVIGGNQLGTLPSWLSELHNLEELYLWDDALSSLPDWWDNFPALRVLDLSRNRLSALPLSLGKLTKLEHLDLSCNRLTDLPESLDTLQALRVTALGGNGFRALPRTVTRWSNLECLDLNNDPDILVTVSATDTIDIRRAPGVGQYRKSVLKTLHPGLRRLTKLRTLLLYGNELLGLPDELLGSVPESIWADKWQGSVDNILDYYFRTKGGARPLNEAKLILLGWGGVGKTSLVKRLIHDSFDPSEQRTEGIEVTSWPVALADDEHVRLNVWDFGGQEIMHATHQFFLTSRSLYLIVLTGRAGSADTDADYWLRIVSSFAPESPIIIVLNQIAKDPFELDEAGLRQRFPNICAFVRTDCAEGDHGLGIKDLGNVLLEATSNLRDLRVSFPASWFEIKDRLAGMREDYLTFDQYRQICVDFGEMDGLAQEQLADYLHSLGIALNYREDPRLRDTHVLNPHWATEGIYTILNSRLVAGHHGEVTASDLARILDTKRYPAERHVFLLDLMRRFELCFPYADEPDKYLVADLLPKQQPAEATNFPVGGSLRFEYRYPLLPEGLLPRFIVRSHVHSADQPRWRSGALMRWEQNGALVQADSTNRIVRIFVTGPVKSRRRLLAVIRSDFEHIHNSYRFKVSAFVPSPDPGGLTVEYDKLLAAENEGRESFPEYCNGTFVNVDVRRYLTGVDLAVAPSPLFIDRSQSSARIFVSYSHKDERYREAFDSHLKVFNSARLLEVWHDRRIGPGDDWKGEIDQALERADIVVFLVSAAFLASDYCNDVEMSRAFERYAAGNCRIVPVIVRDAKWQLTRLAGFQALPKGGKPITTWANQDTAWRNVADGLEHIIMTLPT